VSQGPLKILFVGALPPHQGGSAISCAQLLRAIAAAGHKVHAIAAITPDHLSSGDLFAVTHPELQVSRFITPQWYRNPAFPPPDDVREAEQKVPEKLEATIKMERPDILYIGNEGAARLVVPVALRHDLPCVVRIAGGQITGITSGSYPLELARETLQAITQADVVVTQAAHLAAALRELGCRRVRTIPNLVDLQRFAPRPKDSCLLRSLQVPRHATVIMHASNLKEGKRPLDVVRSAEIVLRERPDLIYVMAGDGPLRAEIEDTSRQLRVSHSFRFTGWIEYHRMPEYLNLADVVAMTSAAEQQARVYLETQACSRLLLASDIPAAREVIEDSRTGLLFRMGDVQDLAAKTVLAASCPELRREVGSRARQAVESHDLQRIASAHIDLLEQVAGRRLRQDSDEAPAARA